MKKRLFSAVLVLCMLLSLLPATALAEGGVAIDETNFPDEIFRGYVSENFDTDSDGYLSDAEIAAATEVDVEYMGITSLKGIEYFTQLQSLLCGLNQLTVLDLSSNPALTSLSCNWNQLTVLDVSSNPALEYLAASSNQLTSLDLSNNTKLTSLDCGCNQLTFLDLSSNPALKYLDAWDNQLTSLDLSSNPALTFLNCNWNQLTVLDVSCNPALEYLDAASNQITSLDVSCNPALESLYASDNQLTALDLSNNTKLTSLVCGYNQLTVLDVSCNPALKHFDACDNQLTSLDVSCNPALTFLNCGGNQLTVLDVSCNTLIKWLDCENNRLTKLDVSKNAAITNLECGKNALSSLDVSNNPALESLWCENNNLTSLDLSSNTALIGVSADSNTFSLGEVSDTYSLDYLPGGFDAYRASNWNGATYDAETNTLSGFSEGDGTVTYSYATGNADFPTVTFTLTYTHTGSKPSPKPSPEPSPEPSQEPPPENQAKIVGFTPANGTTDLNPDQALTFQIAFDRQLRSSSAGEYVADVDLSSDGAFAIYRYSDDALIYKPTQYETRNYIIGGWNRNASKSKMVLKVTPGANSRLLLESNTKYYITMGEGFVTFVDGSTNPAIEKGDWVFTTASGGRLMLYLPRSSATLTKGQSLKLTPNLRPENAVITGWTSSNPSVATVDSTGKVTGVSEGMTVIWVSASCNGETKYDDCIVYVKDNVKVTFNTSKVNLVEGQTQTITCTVLPKGTTPTFTSDDPSVVKIEGNTATAVGVGEAIITATVNAEGQTATATLTVNVESAGKDESKLVQDFVNEAMKYKNYRRAHFSAADQSKLKPGDWCVDFIQLMASKTGVSGALPSGVRGTWDLYNGIKDIGGQIVCFDNYYSVGKNTTRDKYTPEPGDIVFMSFNNSKGMAHAGIVYSVDKENKKMTVIAGNSGKNGPSFVRVQTRSYTSDYYYWNSDADNGKFSAFARPDWSKATGVVNGKVEFIINCPVQVRISYDGEVLDSATEQWEASFGSMKRLKDDGIQVTLNGYFDDADIEITGTGDGFMDLTATITDDDGTTSTSAFEYVPITETAESQSSATLSSRKTSIGVFQSRHFLGRLLMRSSTR